MAKKPSTKARQQEQQEKSIFELLSEAAPGYGQPDPEPQQGADGQNQQQQQINPADLLVQIEALNKQIEGLKQVPLPQAQAPAPPKQPGNLNLEGLPDPVDDPQGYASGVSERIQAHTRAQNEWAEYQNQQRSQRQNRVSTLWQDFAIRYPEYAKDKTKAEFAAQVVAQQAMSRGVDVDRYMFEHTDRFLAEVARSYEGTFGKPDGEDEDDPTQRPASRTAGIFGGSESGGRPNAGNPPPQQGDMIKELHDVQRKLGIY